MKLTVGMALYDDYDGLFFTLEALRCYHDLGRYQAEVIVVDNHPDGPFAGDIEHYVSSIREVPARLIRMASPVGTSAPRDAVFQHAAGEIVMVMDCHVLLTPGAVPALLDFFNAHPEPALVSGPLVSYDRASVWTHFDPIWRAGMWGIWGTDPRGAEPHSPPFEIPAMGLGLFACQKRFWPGFHPLARGFGGEECYIHEKIRRIGGKAWCLPALRWIHRFHNQSKPTAYPNLWRDRVRNYILEFLELGLDLTPVRQHFVTDHPVLSAEDFDRLSAECRNEWDAYLDRGQATTTSTRAPWWPDTPEGTTTYPRTNGCGCGKPRVHFPSLQDWVAYERKDFGDDHFGAITDAVRGVGTVVVANATGAITAACLAGEPAKIVAINREAPDWWWPQATAVRGNTEMVYLKADAEHVGVRDVDALVIAGVCDADQLLAILDRYKPRRRAVVLGTETCGEFASEATRPGLRPAIRRFVKEHPGWLTIRHIANGGGLTVLSADRADRPALPSAWQMVKNFARAVKEHVATGGRKVSKEVLEERLSICALCDRRTVDQNGQDRCSVCGCLLLGGVRGLGGKAEWADQECPLGKWLR